VENTSLKLWVECKSEWFKSTLLDIRTLVLVFNSSSFEPVAEIYCLAALDLGAGVEQSVHWLINQNRQAIGAIGKSMDWTLKNDMLNGLFLCSETGIPPSKLGLAKKILESLKPAA